MKLPCYNGQRTASGTAGGPIHVCSAEGNGVQVALAGSNRPPASGVVLDRLPRWEATVDVCWSYCTPGCWQRGPVTDLHTIAVFHTVFTSPTSDLRPQACCSYAPASPVGMASLIISSVNSPQHPRDTSQTANHFFLVGGCMACWGWSQQTLCVVCSLSVVLVVSVQVVYSFFLSSGSVCDCYHVICVMLFNSSIRLTIVVHCLIVSVNYVLARPTMTMYEWL